MRGRAALLEDVPGLMKRRRVRVCDGCRCSVLASYVAKRDVRVNIVAMYGEGQGATPMWGNVVHTAPGDGHWYVRFDALPEARNWDMIRIHRSQIVTHNPETIKYAKPAVFPRCVVSALPGQLDGHAQVNTGVTRPPRVNALDGTTTSAPTSSPSTSASAAASAAAPPSASAAAASAFAPPSASAAPSPAGAPRSVPPPLLLLSVLALQWY